MGRMQHSPSGDPRSKRSPPVATKLSTPKVETTRGGISRADLRHGKTNHKSESTSNGPSIYHGHGSSKLKASVVQCCYTSQDRYDGEAHGKAGDHPAQIKRKQQVSMPSLKSREAWMDHWLNRWINRSKYKLNNFKKYI